MTKEPANRLGSCLDRIVDDDDAISRVTEPATVETQVSSQERGSRKAMKVAKNFLLVFPLGATHINADLPKMDSPPPKLVCLTLGDVVIEKIQAADLGRERTSLTIPRRIKDKASRTASGFMAFR